MVLPDLRGCGWSTAGLADGQYMPDAVVNDLLSLIDELGAGKIALAGCARGKSADPPHVQRSSGRIDLTENRTWATGRTACRYGVAFAAPSPCYCRRGICDSRALRALGVNLVP